MSKFRNLQFLRNVQSLGSFANHGLAVEAAKTAIGGLSLKDGEIALYRYEIANEQVPTGVHTIVGVAYGEGETQKIEIVANYDMLTTVVESLDATVRATSDGNVSIDGQVTVTGNTGAYVAVEVDEVDGKLNGIKIKENIDETIAARISEAINALDGTATIATVTGDVVTLKAGIVETDGIVSNNTDADIVLAKVAKTGAAVDVAVAAKVDENGVTVVPAGTVQGTLEAIAAEIDGMDLAATDVVSVSNAEFKASQISEEDGQVTVEDSAILFGFTSQPNNTDNKVVTEAELATATAYTGDNGIKIDENLVVSTNFKFDLKTIPTTSDEGVTTYDTVLSILDKDDNAVLAEVNVNELVKDSFLKSAAKDDTTNELVFVFAEDNGIGDGTITEREVRIPIKELCDVYTTDDVYLQLNETDKYKIEHKEQANLTVGSYGSVTADEIDAAGENVTFKVPTITVDKAGHVTTASENEVTVTLPYFVLTVVGEDNVLNNSEYVNVKAVKAQNGTELTLTSTVKVGAFPTADTELVEGLATVQDVEDFVLNNSSIVTGTENQIAVTNTVDQTGVTTYTVALEAPANINIDADETADYVTPVQTVEDTTQAQHTRISDIEIDEYGRVIAYTKQTVTENFDMGTY